MTTKTPSGLAAGGAGSDDETIDDSLDEILLQANERSMAAVAAVESSDDSLGGGLPRLQLPRPNTATLLGLPSSPLPVPVAADTDLPEITPPVMPRPDDITQIARSSLLDEPTEESTKVEAAETARRAAASKELDELDVALTEQASTEREKALRKAIPSGPRAGDTDEFENPHAAADASDTPASLATDDGDEESTANGRGPLSGSGGPAPTLSLGTPRLPPPGSSLGQPFGARLPAPTITGFAAPSLTASFGVPSPSPPMGIPSHTATYGSPAPVVGYQTPPVSSSGFGGTRASSPAVPIPAPLGAPASVRRSPVFSKVQLPVGGLAAFLVAAFSLGLIFGAILWRGAVAEVPVMVAAPAPTPPPIVAPTVPTPPPAAAAPAATAPVVQPVPAGTAAIYEGEVVPSQPAAAAPAPEPTLVAPSPPPAPTKPHPRKTAPTVAADPFAAPGSGASSASAMTTTPAKATRPKKTSTGGKRDVDSRGVAKGWVDPFAQ